MKLIKITKIIIVVIITVSMPFAANAQITKTGAEKATRESDRSLRKEAEKKLITPPPAKPPEIKKEEEKKIEGPKFFVKKINLVGCESFSPDEFRPIIEKYENKEISFDELNILAKEIETEYLKKGVIAACVIPPQEIKEGVVTLNVIEARMGNLEIQDHRYFSKNRILYYWKIKAGEILHYDKIVRSLQLISSNPDRQANATLHAGEKPKTTDVSLGVDTRFPIHLIGSFDREGAVPTGRYRKGFGLKHNNFLGLDDTLLGGYTYSDHYNGFYVYHKVPVTSFGTYVLYGYSYSKDFPKKEYTPYGIDSRVKNTSVFVYQDLFNKDIYLGEVHLGLDANDNSTKTIFGTANHDKLRILRLGSNLVYRALSSITYLNPEISQGLNILGARKKSELSSRGAKSTFTKFDLGIEHKRALPLNLEGVLKFKGQFATTKLTPQEQFFMGGINSVRGYPAGDYLADNAAQANLELLIPAFFIPDSIKFPNAEKPLKDDITGLLFFDYGYGKIRGALEGERKHVNFASVGAGVRVRLFNQVFLRFEWGFPVGDRPITESGDSRFHVSIDFEDRIPEEIEKIDKQRKTQR